MSSPAPEHPGRLRPTSIRDILTTLMAGLVLGAVGLAVFRLADAVVPVTPWSLVGTLLVLAAAAVFYARSLAARVREERASVSPEEGVRALVLGKVMLTGGVLLAGMHVVYVLDNLSRWSVPAPHDRVVHGLVTVAASAVFAWAGWVLEQACRTDPGEDADDDQAAPAV